MLDYDWVYPFGAFLVALPLGLVETPFDAVKLWAVVTVVLNLVVLVCLDKLGPVGVRASWFWVLFIWFTGGAAVSQLESMVAPLVILAGLQFKNSPVWLAAAFAMGTWIKIFPAALLASQFALGSWVARRAIITSAVSVSAGLYSLAWMIGAGPRFWGFVEAQSARGLQIESMWAQPIQVARALGLMSRPPEAGEVTRTYEFTGSMAETLVSVADIGFYTSLVAISIVMFVLQRRRGSRTFGHPTGEVIAGALVVSLLFILMNKVGSPQFGLWYGSIIVLGMVVVSDRRMTSVIPVLALGSTLFAQLVFPLFYGEYLLGTWFGVGLGLTRWVLIFAMFCVAVHLLVKPSGPRDDSVKTRSLST